MEGASQRRVELHDLGLLVADLRPQPTLLDGPGSLLIIPSDWIHAFRQLSVEDGLNALHGGMEIQAYEVID